ncbi:hypothetical protein ACFS5J_00020 [Flavobacterium chuncheonense]|uniref:Uncharacterized protein n=1 Tax=Flavobacterium chuncheonense TaxID=2026653 RepID=A0ABW5YHL5_9FLAO
MTERIILTIVALIMFALTIKKSDIITIILTTCLTFGILITWSGVQSLISIGIITYMLTALVIAIINLEKKGLSKFNRRTIFLAGLFSFFSNLFAFMQWPFTTIIRFCIIIPLAFFLISLFKGIAKRDEIGQLTIINIELLLKFLR